MTGHTPHGGSSAAVDEQEVGWIVPRRDEGALTNLLLLVQSLPLEDVEALAQGPAEDTARGSYGCRVCNVLKDDNYPNEPQERHRYAGWQIVKWHTQPRDGDGMWERCCMVYLAARLRLAMIGVEALEPIRQAAATALDAQGSDWSGGSLDA